MNGGVRDPDERLCTSSSRISIGLVYLQKPYKSVLPSFEKDDDSDVTDDDEDQEVITIVTIIEYDEDARMAELSYPCEASDATPMEGKQKQKKRRVCLTCETV
ncbi:hypothetical protein FQA39_LY04711 [Lamprigera yunnana]|nr:hypothetical protein FQA39_LY04711 [Lamprigera yunnana]